MKNGYAGEYTIGQVNLTERRTERGFRFEAACPETGPPELVLELLRSAQQWCSELVNSHPNLTARAWREDNVVTVEALGNSEEIGHNIESLKEAISEVQGPQSVGHASRMPMGVGSG
jgi:hypothetical protein